MRIYFLAGLFRLMCIIIPLTRNVEPLTRKGKQLTRKAEVNFYGFIFLLKRIFSGNSGIKNVLPTMRKHYRLAALLHDVFRKPHRQKVYLKPKYKAKNLKVSINLEVLIWRRGRVLRSAFFAVFSSFKNPTERLFQAVFYHSVFFCSSSKMPDF